MNLPNAPELVFETRLGGVLTLTLGDPPAHPLSLDMIAALHRAIGAANADAEVRVIVLYGPGKIFCAGHDMKEIKRHRLDADQGRVFVERLFADCAAMMQALATSPKPTIAMIEGIATAGGLQLMCSCDVVFATPNARFSLPGVDNRGFCTTPAVAVGRSLGRRQVMEMALSGDKFGADWALAAGLINRIVPSEELTDTVAEFATKLAERHAPAITLGKATLDRQLALPLDQAYEQATQVMIEHFMDPERIARDLANEL